MVSIELRVDEKPPKKIRGKSLWTADSQASLVKALRRAAYDEREALKVDPFKKNISITIEVQLPASNNDPKRQEKFWGDLDNLVSGVCESLQKAHPRYKFISDDPTGGKPVIYDDDSQIDSIHATKIVVSDSEPAFYKVSIKESEHLTTP